jgi:hypothetical protein
MTNVERVDATRKRRENNVGGARASRRLSSAIDARRRLNASQADTASDAARLEARAPDPPIDLAARRDEASDDHADAERWLDEGGSFMRRDRL